MVAARFPTLQIGVRDVPVPSWEAAQEMVASSAFIAVLDQLSDGVLLLDRSHRVRLLNKAAEHLVGADRRDVRGLALSHLARIAAIDLDRLPLGSARTRRCLLSRRGSVTSVSATVHQVSCSDADQGLILVVLHAQAVTEAPVAFDPANSLSVHDTAAELVARGIRAYGRRARILVTGESGVGKTEVARYIHRAAAAPEVPFVHVNCGSIPETLFETEMFGYERGAFTGALQAGRRGYIEAASDGTLFLDEVGEVPLTSQAKLLKFLDDGSIQPVGSSSSRAVNAQIIAATNRDLRSMVAAGTFRRDLYYRLATFTLRVPPLREHPALDAFLERMLGSVDPPRTLMLSDACRSALMLYDYPGNIRELKNILEHLVIVGGEVADVAALPEQFHDKAGSIRTTTCITPPVIAPGGKLKDQVRNFEQGVVLEALARFGSKREAARQLGVDIATLIRKAPRNDGRGRLDGHNPLPISVEDAPG